MKLNGNNLLDAVKELRTEGYNEDYIIEGENIVCMNSKMILGSQDFEVEKAFRFEIAENEADTQFLFTIINKQTGRKGLLIDMMGDHYFDLTIIAEKMKNFASIHISQNNEPTKYGMPKISKQLYNQEPERFELRFGYPDMPACPFGNSFKALGFDKRNNEYVWLVTSIIKDDRLKRVDFEK